MRSIQEELSWDEFDNINVLNCGWWPFNRQLIMQILGKLPNVKVFEAQSGEEALLFLLDNKNIDIILLDIHMPGMNGFETLKAIKKSKEHKYVSVIIVTTDPDERVKALEMGAVDLISKPYNADTIREKVYLYSKKQKSKKGGKKDGSSNLKDDYKLLYTENDMESMQKSLFRNIILFDNSVINKHAL